MKSKKNKKYHTIGTIPKSYKEANSIPLNTQTNDRSNYWIGTGTKYCIPFYRYSGAFWIGVFSDDTTTDVYNVKKQPFNFTNWNETSFGPEN
jgi:hypothetical protein